MSVTIGGVSISKNWKFNLYKTLENQASLNPGLSWVEAKLGKRLKFNKPKSHFFQNLYSHYRYILDKVSNWPYIWLMNQPSALYMIQFFYCK